MYQVKGRRVTNGKADFERRGECKRCQPLQKQFVARSSGCKRVRFFASRVEMNLELLPTYMKRFFLIVFFYCFVLLFCFPAGAS